MDELVTEPEPIEIKKTGAASLDPEYVAASDADLRQLLAERFPDEPLKVAHRVFAMVGRAPA